MSLAADQSSTRPSRAAQAALRQPMLDGAGVLQGYELLDPAGTGASACEFLQSDEARRLAERRLLFLPAFPGCLEDAALQGLPPERVVLVVAPPPEDDPARIAGALPMLEGLRKRGMRLAVPRKALKKAYQGWLELAAYVKLDSAAMQPELIAPVLGFIARHTSAQPIACDVDSQARFEQLRGLGVPLFQGDWFSRPAQDSRGSIRPSQAVVIQLMNLLQRDAGVEEIAPLLKRDPSLSFNLLRVINSAAMGLAFEVTSLQHAIMLLGQKRLFRWATSLMVMARAAGTAPAVAQSAMVRGRLMELLATELLAPAECDNAFVTGVFSLLDVLLDMPMADALDALALPEPVADALLRGGGLLAPFLTLTLACENRDDAAFARAAEALQLSDRQINWAHLQALAWAEELTDGW